MEKRLGVIEGSEFRRDGGVRKGEAGKVEKGRRKKDVKSRGKEEKGKKRCRSRISLITVDKVIDNS